jgi:hypothetical protein
MFRAALLVANSSPSLDLQENFRRLYRDRLLEDRTISIKVPQGMQQPFGHAMEPGLAVQARRWGPFAIPFAMLPSIPCQRRTAAGCVSVTAAGLQSPCRRCAQARCC